MENKNKVLHITVWILQIFMGLMFLIVGGMKAFSPLESLPPEMAWALENPNLVRFVGISQLLGAIGLIVPSLLRIKPFLTPLAALGFATIMILAIGFHAMRSEMEAIPTNIVLLLVFAFIAWARWKKVPIQAK